MKNVVAAVLQKATAARSNSSSTVARDSIG